MGCGMVVCKHLVRSPRNSYSTEAGSADTRIIPCRNAIIFLCRNAIHHSVSIFVEKHSDSCSANRVVHGGYATLRCCGPQQTVAFTASRVTLIRKDLRSMIEPWAFGMALKTIRLTTHGRPPSTCRTSIRFRLKNRCDGFCASSLERGTI